MTKKFEFTYRDKVRYGDCDMHQHVNHAKFFTFFEQARVEYCASLGLKPSSDFKSIPFILASASCDYLLPALLNDEIIVEMGTTKIGTKSLTMEYEMKNGKGELLAKASTVLVMFDYETMRSIPVPKTLKQKIAELKKGR
ncbi:MAG: thioesterase family protein [Deltaproteobacteria bacterium]|nr:thioesterase family protein [Deltaproteobacteria bacterium]